MSTVQPDYRFYNYSCKVVNIQAVSGTWSSYATTLEERQFHTSWVTPEEKLVLMGGEDSGTTTEIVNGGMNFTLVQDTQ